MYISFAKSEKRRLKTKETKFFLDYLGSYSDPQRATEEMKRDDDSSSSNTIYKNISFEKDKPPVVKMSKEDKEKFDKAMDLKFGGLQRLTGEDPSDFEDEQFDEILAPG